MIEVTETSFDDVVKANPTCVVDFSATWCGPCQKMKPVLKAVEESTGVPVLMVDVSKCPNLTNRFGVKSVPTVILMRNGQAAKRTVGAQGQQTMTSFVRDKP